MTKIILKDFVYMYIDGASRGNPGPSSCAFVVRDKNHELVMKKGKCIGVTTCNVAEYQALIFGLEEIIKLPFRGKIIVRSDSMLLVRQMSRQWKIKNQRLKECSNKAKGMIKEFKSVKFKHLPRRYNRESDKLCNETLNRSKKEKINE